MNLRTSFDETTSGVAPQICVGITLYNYGRYIEECLDSLAAQDLEVFDVTVVDDCSTDDSLRIAVAWMESHHKKFRRARVLTHVRNQGLAAARNAIFETADTPYVFVLDADNKLLPNCLQEHLKAMERTGAGFVYGIIATFGETHALHSAIEWMPAKLRNRNYYDAMSLVPVATWKTCGGYSVNMPAMGWEDYDFWIKCHLQGLAGVVVPKILSLYRTHNTSMINTETNLRAMALRRHMESQYPGFFGVHNTNTLAGSIRRAFIRMLRRFRGAR